MTARKKQDDRIADLERRVKELEARPVIAVGYPVHAPQWPSWQISPYGTTIGGSIGHGTSSPVPDHRYGHEL